MFVDATGEKLGNRGHSHDLRWTPGLPATETVRNKWEPFPTEARAKTACWLTSKKKDDNSVASKVFVVLQLPYTALAMAQADCIATPTAWALPSAQEHLLLCICHCRSTANSARTAHDDPAVQIWSGSGHGIFGRLGRIHTTECFLRWFCENKQYMIWHKACWYNIKLLNLLLLNKSELAGWVYTGSLLCAMQPEPLRSQFRSPEVGFTI